MKAVACPSQQELAAFVLGTLDLKQMQPLVQHTNDCPRCQDRLHELDQLVDPLVEIVKQAGQPSVPLSGAQEGLRPTVPLSLEPTEVKVGAVPASAAEHAAGVPADVEDLVLRLLQPSRASGELGRLGNYRILNLLGRGGMGAVFLAEDVRLQRTVALKVMLPEFACRDDARQRFLREARSAAAIEHDNIVTIFQVDEDQGVPFIAMPLLKGQTLEDRLDAGLPVSVPEMVSMARQVARGLTAAHEHGLNHRDIKPANIWLEGVAPDQFRVKLLDFGLARPCAASEPITQSGVVVGTPAYMAPEQARSEAVDNRGDLFSLGVVLYRLCTGNLPFQGPSTMSVLMALGSYTPPAPHTLNLAIPLDLSLLVMQMLEKDPAQRPASARDVIARLQKIEADSQGVTTNLRPGVRSQPAPASTPRASFRRRSSLLVAVAAGILALAGGVIYIVTDNGVVVIDTEDDQVQVSVVQNGKEIQVLDAASKKTWVVNTGTHTVRLKDAPSGLEIVLPDTFQLKRGDKHVVTIRKVKVPVVVGPGPPKEDPADFTGPFEKLPWQALFNGKDLTGWKYHALLPGDWQVQDGLLVGTGRKGWLFSERDGYGDFHLRAELKVTANCDSGIFFWTSFDFKGTNPRDLIMPRWHEVNIANDSAPYTGSLSGQDLLARVRAAPARVDDWFVLEVIASGKQVVTRVNGKTVARLVYPQARPGHLALQAPIRQKGTIYFRKIEIKVPDRPAAQATPLPVVVPFNAARAREHQEAWAKHLGVAVETTNSLGMKFRLVPPGEFFMGAAEGDLSATAEEKPRHKVRLTRAFAAGVHEVTTRQFRAFIEETGYKTLAETNGLGTVKMKGSKTEVDPDLSWRTAVPGGPDHPVSCLSHADADRFCVWLSQNEKRTYRLLTEAEWEYACRAGTDTRFSSGDQLGPDDAVVKRPLPLVGSCKANAFGLHDMHGSVYEWTSDALRSYAGSVTDPVQPGAEGKQVLRGGAATSAVTACRSSSRTVAKAAIPFYMYGFRVALEVGTPPPAVAPDKEN